MVSACPSLNLVLVGWSRSRRARQALGCARRIEDLPSKRERLRRHYVTVALRCGELQLAGGDPLAAIRTASLAVAADASDEAVHRLLMRSHPGTGDRSAARAALLRALDELAALGVDPDPATRERTALLDADR